MSWFDGRHPWLQVVALTISALAAGVSLGQCSIQRQTDSIIESQLSTIDAQDERIRTCSDRLRMRDAEITRLRADGCTP